MTPRDKKLLEFLYAFITAERKQRFEEVLAYRTRHVTVVLEDIYQSHNASAVLRSCDLTGVQDVHIIENHNVYDINPDIVVGSTKWLNLHKYNELDFNTPAVFDMLHARGYQIAATCPHRNDFTPDTLPIDRPVALVFGTEKTGLTGYAISHADMHVRIPMFGFTESFNISVSAALLMHALTNRLHASSDINWKLTDEEKDELRLAWTRNTLSRIKFYDVKFNQLYPDL